jgi:hypothetical protein
MYREMILEFIRRKNELLKGHYIPGHTPEEMWPYDEELSQQVALQLHIFDDCTICPWCLLGNPCNECLYRKEYGECSSCKTDNQYGKICLEVLEVDSITDWLKSHPKKKQFLMEALDAE